MKDLLHVLSEKEAQLRQLTKEVEALRLVRSMLAEPDQPVAGPLTSDEVLEEPPPPPPIEPPPVKAKRWP